MAMGWEEEFSLPADIAWSEVLRLAYEQGVAAIALDGYEEYLKIVPKNEQVAVSPQDKMLIIEAIGQLQLIEQNFAKHQEVVRKLGDILHKKEIPFVIMKGFACGQYYPNPKHRECGDIDIYPGELFDECNKSLKEAGAGVDPYYYRHSASYIDGVMIENHRVLCDLRGPRRQTKELEALLEQYANDSLKHGKTAMVDGAPVSGATFPIANFNALFLPWHVSAHFMVERVTLRHLLDWALFLVHDGNGIGLELYRHAKKNFTFGYSKMVDILTNLSLRYLNMPAEGVPTEIIDDARKFDDNLADRVFEYMFVGQPKDRGNNVWQERMNNLKRIWKERWKYKEVYNQSTAGFLWYKITGALFKVGE
jgi:hypothetical protein